MSGRVLVSILLAASLVFAAFLWYFQVYAYYQPVTLTDREPTVQQSDPSAVQVEVSMPGTGKSESGITVSGGEQASIKPPAKPEALQAATGSDGVGVDSSAPGKPKVTATPTQDRENMDNADESGAGNSAEGADAAPGLPADPDDNIKVTAVAPTTVIRMTRVWDNRPEVIDATDFKGIDAATSPLKFKGCFKVPNSIPMMTEAYVVYDDPTPLKAPIWFRCYNYKRLTEDLEAGDAVAFLGEANIAYGIDRVIAVYGDGRAYSWHQINPCGTAAFAGDPLPEACPPQPER